MSDRLRQRLVLAALAALLAVGGAVVWFRGHSSNGWTPDLVQSAKLACYEGAWNAHDRAACDCTVTHLQKMIDGTSFKRLSGQESRRPDPIPSFDRLIDGVSAACDRDPGR
jgi:hypothetical protein